MDKRARNTEVQAKRQKLDGGQSALPVYATQFSKEEIEGQERKPKRKVAVMIGYSGSGYKGMQLNHHEKTIEGDLFSAFVDAGAISKANADDPKKSSLIRCARTDKGVHAAGNLISLKLIVEDSDVVAKINQHLSPQIRVWGIIRTNGSFSAYQFCDSRIYEYLIPTHCFLPPHPRSFLGKKMFDLAEEADDLKGYLERQEEVANVWAEMEERYVQPVIDNLDPTIRDLALRAFYEHDVDIGDHTSMEVKKEQNHVLKNPSLNSNADFGASTDTLVSSTIDEDNFIEPKIATNESNPDIATTIIEAKIDTIETNPDIAITTKESPKPLTPLETAIRQLRAAHIIARKAYRIPPSRLARVRSSLSRYVGSHKFHNYTIEKSFKDPSATRQIMSFKVGEEPIIINDTEWLSLKVHGQSFMMHQIRKLVSMVALVVRCGCHEGRLQDSYMADRLSIPKAPSLGLLLERPVFDVYNEKLEQFGRERIDFSRYEKEMEEFKQREIYERIFREEERDNTFHNFFTGLDHTRSSQLFYLSSLGIDATKKEIPREPKDKLKIEEAESEEEGEQGEGG